MVDAAALAALVLLGLHGGAQPAFDAAWGGPTACTRPARAGACRRRSTRWRTSPGAGVPLAFGSDSRWPLGPWAAVRAAVLHHEREPAHLGPGCVPCAHAWRLARGRAGRHGAGELRVGAPATSRSGGPRRLAVQAPDGRLAAWSTDPRAGTPLLPELGPDSRARCLRTIRDGACSTTRSG